MGFIAQALGLGGGGDGGASAAQQRQMDIQQKQEERLTAQEAEQGRALAASIRARTRGGYRQLLSPERIAPETGLPTKLSGL
jgi:hypothetical protein